MKKKGLERVYILASVLMTCAIFTFFVLFIMAIIDTVKGDRASAAFHLLWGIVIDMLFTAFRNQASEMYNESFYGNPTTPAEQQERKSFSERVEEIRKENGKEN